ncbi:MAG: metal ABC transporter permease [Verrucomicrobia bacterium]|nr:metal ABC transporter permease [Verrucomicrobiota bacterium]
MNSFFEAICTNQLLLFALLAGLVASIVGGIIGSYVVVKRIAFISGSISHSVLAGIGFFLWLERTKEISFASPLQGALLAGVLSAMLIGWIHLKYKQREDSVIAAVWSIGMAIGILFISQTPGYNVELTNFLVGNLLWVSPQDLLFLCILDVAVILACYLLHHKLLAICFDEDQARLQGLAVNRLYLLLLSLIAITVVLLMQVVGIILVMTMLTLPATIANLYTNQLSRMMGISMLLSMAFCFLGMFLSFHLDWPAGATIALVAGVTYALSLLGTFRK